MEIKRIGNVKQFDKIYHISDVHIRTLKRHAEYRQVFENLFNYINSTATPTSCCVVTGDIVHSKLDMSPELVKMLTEFFNGFKIPTIVILGNHDMNLNNMHRIDAISPVLDVIKNENIYFIKENGLFEFGGIVWNHMAVDVPPTEYISADKFQAPFKIALHHGAVHSAKTDIGYEISNEHVTTSIFDGHDLVLLGDIHKPAQFLNEERTIAYPGSLCQQNHSEALTHGILVWDTKTRSAEFVEIENEYGYVTFELQDTTVVSAPSKIPKRPRVRIKFNGTSAADMKKFIAGLRKKYQVEDISIQRKTESVTSADGSSISIGNVRDVEYQNALITEYIENNFPTATEQEIDAARHINRTINSKLPVLETIRNITWHPISFEFDNMFSYGEGNKIDFTNLSDVVGLFAPNTSGKSSLLDAITYTIFDKCSKTSKANEVLNNKKDWFRGVFRFEMNGVTYTIERVGTQNKKKETHVRVEVNFYTDTENLNGEERSETNKNIRNYLGTYEDFILTAFSLQADNNNFIEKSQRERKDLLSQFLDITVFEQLYELANNEIKETAGRLKDYKKTDFAEIIRSCDDVINEHNETIVDLESTESTLQESRNSLQTEILELIESKQPTTYSGQDLDVLEREETKQIKTIETIQSDIDALESKIEQNRVQIKQYKQDLVAFNIEALQTKIDQYNQLYTELSLEKTKYEKLKGVIDAKQQKIDHLKTHEYDPNCKYCTSNVFVQDAIEASRTIIEDKNILLEQEAKIKTLLADAKELEQYKNQYTQREGIQRQLQAEQNVFEKNELTLQILENDLQTKEAELETILERQELFKQNATAINYNKQVDVKIEKTKNKIADITEQIRSITTQIKSYHGEIEVAKTKRKTAIEQLDTYKKLETEYKAYEYYLQSVSRDGIPYELISKALPKIETEINNVLNQIVDFNMVLNTDGKNINGFIIYDEDNFWPLELTSGMERFISSLAIRVALINVSALPRPNFIAIDEGFGTLDNEHIVALQNMFEYFKQKFDFSIIISHVDSMRDMVDAHIDVSKDSGFSKICNV
jgi:DNA repair exonuclease SbcCD ATPase subunit/DNA repair exonuclease SbcCD nuclease subunit